MTLESARAAASAILHPKRFSIVVAGDRNRIEADLKKLGMPIKLWDARGRELGVVPTE